jgi:branched-chain amino acid transport system ATP-binding protein
MPEALLELEDVRAGYGEAVVLDGISFSLPEQGSLAVLGRNGAGKTTVLLAALGLVRLARGAVRLNGVDVGRVAPHRRAQMGLGWIPQEREIFPSLTVEENLTVTARPGKWDAGAVYRLFPRLQERRTNMGSQLSGGEQQMLAIGRTLATNPTVLLLDEPLEGLAPILVEELAAAIKQMKENEGVGLLLVEQHAELALELTEEVIVIERGIVAHRAPSRELLADRAALDRYLGLGLGGSA